jgi:Arc/MetJ-type ribon-helix-helix transcriptional regulator
LPRQGELQVRDQLSVRLPHELNAAVAERAKRDARRPSDVVRLALQAYLKEPVRNRRDRPERAREGAGSQSWGKSEMRESETSIELRRVPVTLYQELETRAARERLSLPDYVVTMLRQWYAFERLERQPPVKLGVSAAELVRQDRDSR